MSARCAVVGNNLPPVGNEGQAGTPLSLAGGDNFAVLEKFQLPAGDGEAKQSSASMFLSVAVVEYELPIRVLDTTLLTAQQCMTANERLGRFG